MPRPGALKTGPTGLADLVRLWAQALQADLACDRPQDAWCRLLDVPGFIGGQGESMLLPRQPDFAEPELPLDPADPQPLPAPDVPPTQRPRLQAPVLAVVGADFEPEPDREADAVALQALPDLEDRDYQPLEPSESAPWLPLAPLTRWWPVLQRFAPLREAGPDLPRLVGELARCRPARRLPRLRRRGRYRRLMVVRDWRKCMIPHRQDFEQLIARLREQQQTEALVEGACLGFPPAIPSNVGAVLVLSDLGLGASSEPAATAELWAAWARALRARGVAVQAWVPTSARRIPAHLAKVMPCVPWHERSRFRPTRGQRGALPPCHEQRDAWMDRLWPLLAIAQRIEPALLRRARLLAGGEGQPEWETTLWEDSEQHAAGEGFLQLRPSHAPVWRERFARLSSAVQRQVWQMFHAQHAHLPRSTLMVEWLIWAAYADIDAQDRSYSEAVDYAKAWLARMSAQEVRHGANAPVVAPLGEDRALHSGFLHGLIQRNAEDPRFTGVYAETYARLAVAVGRAGQGEVPAQTWAQAISEVAQGDSLHWSLLLHHMPDRQVFEQCFWPVNKDLNLSLVRTRMVLGMEDRQAAIWTPVAQRPRLMLPLHAAEPGELTYRDEIGAHSLTFGHLHRAAWQHALGQDRYGVFCEVLIKAMHVRFRYIPPGTFLQGSPEGVGFDDEHPQHPVTLTRGLWLAETPCTQALWQVVMGNNPSRFKQGEDAPRRPVEQVSWDDVAAFLKKLQPLLPRGCEAVLPSESEWEYACRAGTQTEYGWGNEADDARANWEKQHGGTTPVDRYAPNSWGLYDMHGNVWEWCADGLRDYAAEPARDPQGPGAGQSRVARGGSSINGPGRARAAYRLGWNRRNEYMTQGFRFALMSQVGSSEARPGGPGARRGGAAGGRTDGADVPARRMPPDALPSGEDVNDGSA